MAAITPVSPSPATLTPGFEHVWAGYVAGEDLLACGPVYIKASDGKVYNSTATDPDAAAALVHGYAPKAYKSGQNCSIYFDMVFAYGSGLTPGNLVYLGASGGLVDTAAYVNAPALGVIVNSECIHLKQVLYAYNGITGV